MMDLKELNRRMTLLEYGVSEVLTMIKETTQNVIKLENSIVKITDDVKGMSENEQSSEDIRKRGLCGRANSFPISDS